MKISAVNFNTSFKSSNVFGYGDDVSAKRREGMRQRIEDRELYNVDLFLKEGRKSEFDLNKMIKSITKKPKKLSPDDIRGMAFNVEIYDYDRNIYRGSSLKGNHKALKKLKQAGVETVIDFSLYPGYEEDCKKAGLNYKGFYVGGGFFDQPAFCDKTSYLEEKKMYMTPREIELSADYLKSCEERYDKEQRDFINKFVDYIQTVQKGNYYVGCEFGQNRTDNILTLEMLFNPQRDDEREYIDNIHLYAIGLYENLTQEDKAKMGWTEEFDKNFIPKINEINAVSDSVYSAIMADIYSSMSEDD